MFQLTTQAFQAQEIQELTKHGISEVILEPQRLARRGKLSSSDLLQCLKQCQEHKIKALIQWDILNDELYFQQTTRFVQELPLEQIHAFRIQDPGAAFWFQEAKIPTKLQLICETGNRNLLGLQKWIELFSASLERLILSSEIPGPNLKEWIPQLTVPCELLGLGPILLFYSPRKLLTPHFGAAEEHQVLTQSPESQNRSFLTLENANGSFMYNPKDLSLLDYIEELSTMGLAYLRLDRYDNPQNEILLNLQHYLQHKDSASLQKLKETWKNPWIHGFYKGNRSDLPMERLKNTLLENRSASFIAEVVEVKKNQYILIHLDKSIHRGDALYYHTPDGHIKPFRIHSLQSSSGKEVPSLQKGEIGILPWSSRINARSLIFSESKENSREKSIAISSPIEISQTNK